MDNFSSTIVIQYIIKNNIAINALKIINVLDIGVNLNLLIAFLAILGLFFACLGNLFIYFPIDEKNTKI